MMTFSSSSYPCGYKKTINGLISFDIFYTVIMQILCSVVHYTRMHILPTSGLQLQFDEGV